MELTSKQLAQQIVTNYEYIQRLGDFDGMDLDLAKECAILEIEGRIEELKANIGYFKNDFYCLSRMVFLEEVKQEINNL